MDELKLSAEDQLAIKNILLRARAEGVETPLLPMNVDVNGDGASDSFGLDIDNNVTVVSGVDLMSTLYSKGP